MMEVFVFERSMWSLWIYTHMVERCYNKLLSASFMSIMSVLWEYLLNVLCPRCAALHAATRLLKGHSI